MSESMVTESGDRVDVRGEFTLSPDEARIMAGQLTQVAANIEARQAEEARTGVYKRPNSPGMWERNGNGRVYRVRIAYGLLTMTFRQGNDWTVMYLPHDLLGGWRKVAS